MCLKEFAKLSERAPSISGCLELIRMWNIGRLLLRIQRLCLLLPSKQPSKVAELIKTTNAFDALGDLDEEHVVSKQASVTIDAFDSPSNTPLVEKINNLKVRLLSGSLCLLVMM